MDSKRVYTGLGLMSGTSLDGVDVAACCFTEQGGKWQYEILAGHTFSYTADMLERLRRAPQLSGLDLALLNVDYGRYLGEQVGLFLQKFPLKVDFIASHGYTVFHEPERGLTLQVGSGAEIAAQTGLQTVYDFRTKDVALRGQGAPLVPIGDRLLFAEYVACLNLGGFSNISFEQEGRRIAFDICPVNFVLNDLSQKLGFEFDKGGELGRKGKILPDLLEQLNALGYYKQLFPKSLGREFVETLIFPLMQGLDVLDCLHTYYVHAAQQMAVVLNRLPQGRVLISGGGVYNNYLNELLQAELEVNLELPSKDLIDYKEALLFAFLGTLRLAGVPNCLSSVTGSSVDNIGGSVIL